MYKKIIALLVLVPSLAFADNSFQANPNQTTLFAQGQFGAAAVDAKGNVFTRVIDPSSGLSQSVIPVSNATNLNGLGAAPIGYISAATDSAEAASTSTVINATSHTARVGDAIQFYSGTAANVNAWSYVVSVTANSITVGSAFPATVATSDNFYIWRPTIIQATNPATSAGGALAVAVDRQNQISVAGGLLKAEDAGHSTGDAGVQVLGIRNETYAQFADGNGDYSPIATYRSGAVIANLDYSALGASDIGVPYVPEDTAVANLKAVMLAGGVAKSAIAQTVSTTEDAAPIALDLGNRTVVTNAPAGETVNGCSATAVTTNTTQTLLAAVASNRYYITGFECQNTGATATMIILEDGTGTDLARCVAAATTGNCSVTVGNIPIRATAANSLIQINVVTTGSSTTCCARGYISTI